MQIAMALYPHFTVLDITEVVEYVRSRLAMPALAQV
jgi:hypothetical protein